MFCHQINFAKNTLHRHKKRAFLLLKSMYLFDITVVSTIRSVLYIKYATHIVTSLYLVTSAHLLPLHLSSDST